jgi:dihydrofolate reductase
MRKIIVGAFVSLDGVMQGPGGPNEDPTGGFTHGGWNVPYFDETLGAAVDGLFDKPFDLLLGRKTYDIFAAHWPFVGPDDLIGPVFDRITKYVATGNPAFSTSWQNTEVLRPDAVAAVRKLKAGTGPDLLTQGSTDLLRSLFETDLVDELVLMIFPVVLGSGKKLFADGAAAGAFRLESSTVSGSGVTVNRYTRSGPVRTGNFQLEPPTEAELERRRQLSGAIRTVPADHLWRRRRE